jgi:hypothetical protein
VMDRGATTEAAALVYSTGDERGRNMHTPLLSSAGSAGPAHRGEGRRSLRAPFLLVFLFLLFLFFTPDPSLDL